MKTFREYNKLIEMNVTKSMITYLTFKFLLLLKQNFKQWKAYELGLIDETGEIIKKANTKEEKEAIDGLTNLVRKIKKLLSKYIKNEKLLSLLVTMYLLKENNTSQEYSLLESELNTEEKKLLFNILTYHRSTISAS